MIKSLDINADVGESYGNFKIGQDEVLMPYLTSCNIACGFHGGDPVTIHKTIFMALENDVAIGAHPSYPDLQGFGRRRMFLPREELKHLIEYQVYALKGMVEAQGGKLHHVKPHGALNNHMMDDLTLLEAVLETVHDIDPKLPVYVPFLPAIRKEGANIRFELFADRSYEEDLRLTPRNIDGSLLKTKEDFEPHLRSLMEAMAITRGGQQLPVEIDTICIHGDNPGALEIAQYLHELTNEMGINLKSVR
ncbi:MAG: 5-oxoprolinase subunit PxpA [Cytophagales bacterium]|nr:5-oxoprolinase subunit PxpA [Cytophagales bacterium]